MPSPPLLPEAFLSPDGFSSAIGLEKDGRAGQEIPEIVSNCPALRSPVVSRFKNPLPGWRIFPHVADSLFASCEELSPTAQEQQ